MHMSIHDAKIDFEETLLTAIQNDDHSTLFALANQVADDQEFAAEIRQYAWNAFNNENSHEWI